MTETGQAMQVALDTSEFRLAEVLDRLLDRGVVIRGELWLTVADVELVFVGADLIVASAEKMRAIKEGEHA